MISEFSQLNLRPELEQAISELGYATPSNVQAQVIPLMLAGRDIIAQSQTGSGKTAAFALPILQHLLEKPNAKGIQALVLTPTRELAIQVAKAISQYGQHTRVNVLPVYGGQSYAVSTREIKKGVDVVVGTPGRLQDLMRKKLFDLGNIHTVVLDEADEMLSMGFVEDIENILSETPAQRQTTLFSATMPKQIRRLANKYMIEPQTISIERKQLVVASIEQRFYLVNEKDKKAALTRLLEHEHVGPTLIFTRTRAGSTRLANNLIQRGFPAEALNGDLAQDARIRVLNRFRSGQIKVLVATDVAARGLDIDDISHVFNFDISTDLEAYVHRIGRTGRAGKAGIAISLVTPGERRALRRIENYTKQALVQFELPSEDDIHKIRENILIEKMSVWLTRDRSKAEEDIATQLVAAGHDPIKVAAAALKIARADEKHRPIEKIGELRQSRSSKNSSQRNRGRANRKNWNKGKNGAHSAQSRAERDKTMVTLSLGRGREHGIGPAEIVGEIASRANIPGSGIGKILIQDKHTLVDIQEEFASRVLGQTGAYNLRGNRNVLVTKV